MTDEEIFGLVHSVKNELLRTIYVATDELTKPKTFAEMLGEFFREAAVLILILVPVDLLLPDAIRNGQRFDARLLKWTIIISVCTLLAGIVLEKWGKRK